MLTRELPIRLRLQLFLLWNKIQLFAKYRQRFYAQLIWVELLNFPNRLFG